jgi:hypothetical protein
MKSDSVIRILKLLNTKNPIFTYARIDKYSEILNNFSFNHIGGIKIPPKIDITKVKIMGDNDDDNNDIKQFNITFNKIIYTFHTYHDQESIYYRLYQEKSDQECIFVIVAKKLKICEIHNISYDAKCLPNAEIKDKKGKSLLFIALKLIDKIKNHYDLKYVQLTDNSIKLCKNKHKIILPIMMTLISGVTWYAKYGFIPKDKFYRKLFDDNKNIMENIYLKDVPEMEKYISYGHYKSKSKIDINKLLNNYNYAIQKNYKLKEFLSKFLLDFDSTCDIFYYFYDILYKKLNINNMSGVTFIKML